MYVAPIANAVVDSMDWKQTRGWVEWSGAYFVRIKHNVQQHMSITLEFTFNVLVSLSEMRWIQINGTGITAQYFCYFKAGNPYWIRFLVCKITLNKLFYQSKPLKFNQSTFRFRTQPLISIANYEQDRKQSACQHEARAILTWALGRQAEVTKRSFWTADRSQHDCPILLKNEP